MPINYKDYQYFENRPDVVRVFDDLEEFHDFCRFELCEFDPAHLYRKSSPIYKNFLRWKKYAGQPRGRRRKART